jgi:hypothetical protein
MSDRRRREALSLLSAAALATVALGLSACGYSSDSKAVAAGESVSLGKLQYQVILSRYLNPHDNEDAAYLVGQPPPPLGSAYFGVFVQVLNESGTPLRLPRSLTITDTAPQTFRAIPSKSLYALPLGGEVEPEEHVPVLNSTPQQGPIEGSLVLFDLPASASDNRPLTLHIPGPEGPAEVTLDL